MVDLKGKSNEKHDDIDKWQFDKIMVGVNTGDSFELIGNSELKYFTGKLVKEGAKDTPIGFAVGMTNLLVIVKHREGQLKVHANYPMTAFTKINYKKTEKEKVTLFSKTKVETEEPLQVTYLIPDADRETFVKLLTNYVKNAKSGVSSAAPKDS
jgi:hypothetical protein